MKISTVNDLYMLATQLLVTNDPDTPICFTNRFREYALDDQYVVEEEKDSWEQRAQDCQEHQKNLKHRSTIIIPCEEVGSILKGYHRVLSKTPKEESRPHEDMDDENVEDLVDSMNSIEDWLDGYSIEGEVDS